MKQVYIVIHVVTFHLKFVFWSWKGLKLSPTTGTCTQKATVLFLTACFDAQSLLLNVQSLAKMVLFQNDV